MAKYESIRALAKKQLQAVTESSDRWKAFLRTAAIAYNYSSQTQLLIHEQSPTATAVADIAYWNNNCLLYTSDAADERSSVDLGGRRINKKKKQTDRPSDACCLEKNVLRIRK